MNGLEMTQIPDRCPVAPSNFSELLHLDPDALANKARYLRDVRNKGPVVWVPELDLFAITEYSAISQILASPGIFSSAIDARGPFMKARQAEAQANLRQTSADFRDLEARLEPDWRRARTLLSTDPPKHTVQRSLIQRLFTPKRVDGIRERAQAIAHELLDDLMDTDTTDVVETFSLQLPLRVIAEQLAIGSDRLTDFRRWSDHLIAPFGNNHPTEAEILEQTRTAVEFKEHFSAALADRRRNPRGDFLTLIADFDDDTVKITEETRLAMISQLLGAGNETSTDMLSSAVVILAERPDLAATLKANPALMGKFIDEVLRLEAPSQGLYRRALETTVVADTTIPESSFVLLLFASGNRSESEFSAPDDIVLDRDNGAQHLSFGRGIHYCVGASLARMEGQVGIAALLARAYPWKVLETEFNRSYLTHGLHRLQVQFPEPIRPQ